ncbi:O-antigen/teichoic acid export membrane protein [Actinopolyspora biskrensis]|uniref:O-antigen/teichoic acid export membrane protein n=1 Tax=Actinopolyspora biskrensis TaxID=1470178 RepID=A0A852YTB7_9ACTN|nr:O-antigen/teichoic acid export membrane protein [Actinopolyspora biskrensis]
MFGKVAGDGVAGILSQAATAAASFAVQLVAAGTLGLSDYGVFALLLAMLVGANALHVGFVCDGFTVFDRHDPGYRSSLVTGALLVMGACVLCAVVLASTASRDGPWLVAVYAVLVVCRLLAETVRRIFVARVNFGSLLSNDLCCLSVTLLALAVAPALFGEPNPTMLFGVMCCGALATILTGLVQLPGEERGRLRPGVREFPKLAGFAVWRALQAGLRPMTLLAVRLLVAGAVSTAAVGVLELARLVVAPVQVLINGSGSLLLGKIAARERSGDERDPAVLGKASRALVFATVVCGGVLGGVALVLVPPVLGKSLDPVLVFGWVAYQVTWAAGLPYVTEIVARRASRRVFRIRLVDSLVGLVLTVAAVSVGATVVVLPSLLALGGIYTVYVARSAVLGQRFLRTDEVSRC